MNVVAAVTIYLDPSSGDPVRSQKEKRAYQHCGKRDVADICVLFFRTFQANVLPPDSLSFSPHSLAFAP